MSKQSVEKARQRAITRRKRRENNERVLRVKGQRFYERLVQAINLDVREFNEGEGLTGSVEFLPQQDNLLLVTTGDGKHKLRLDVRLDLPGEAIQYGYNRNMQNAAIKGSIYLEADNSGEIVMMQDEQTRSLDAVVDFLLTPIYDAVY